MATTNTILELSFNPAVAENQVRIQWILDLPYHRARTHVFNPQTYGIKASVVGNVSIQINADQAVQSAMNQINLSRIEHARRNAFSYSTNLRNLEAPWGLVYRIIFESIKGISEISMDVEEQTRVTAWDDPSDAPPPDLNKTLALRSGTAKTVIPDLDIVLWGLTQNLYPLLAELKPSITRASLDAEGNPLHVEAAYSICTRLWFFACDQVTYQARILFKRQSQAQNHRQAHIVLMATAGDWFTCRALVGYGELEDNAPLEELTRSLNLSLENERVSMLGEDAEAVDTIHVSTPSFDPTHLMHGAWTSILATDINRWTLPAKIRTPAGDRIFNMLRVDMRSFKQMYLARISSS
ncbi:hypothetical protein D9757_010667 [Collybiopsis confluens]|uniref:Uncharacterized protein n=1 Tax=Collybiopsis confluens TaxID=2823264 RepID=A0A8H5GMC2_9AGAR|nr:hypothetical protein D9757_010667 [Collybiopsis confluens]